MNRQLSALLYHFFLWPFMGLCQPSFQQVHETISQLNNNELFSGSVLVGTYDRILFERHAGITDLVTLNPLGAQSSFNLASVSKQFTTAAIMLLKQEGKLDFDDPIDRFFPKVMYPAVTLRHLMTHTSGIPEYFEPATHLYPQNHLLVNEDVVKWLESKLPKPEFSPGDRFSYTNTNYVLLAAVVEKISGTPMRQFLHDHIFKPLGLANTFVYTLDQENWPPSRVFGFRRQGGKYYANDLGRFDGLTGDGNVYASARDLFQWAQALLSFKIIKQETMEEAWKPFRLSDGKISQYGFGWAIDTTSNVVSHTGSWAGFLTFFRIERNTGRVMVVLTNGTNHFMRQVSNSLLGLPVSLPEFTLIHNVEVVDGTGSPAQKGAVRIKGDKIYDIGDLQPLPFDKTVIDGQARTLTPGFIDSHSHHGRDYQNDPAVIPAISQGITTIVIGQDGGSHLPLAGFFEEVEKNPASVNIASYAGHNTLRWAVIGNENFNRTASQEEINQMQALLERELDAGALGLSTGLEYDPGIFSNTEEVIALARTTSKSGGRYISHIRSEDVHLEEALQELIDIGKHANIPVQISHFKIGMKGKWGTAGSILARLQQARNEGVRISADIYPYTYWLSTLEVLFPKRDFKNPKSAAFALQELAPPEGMLISSYEANPSYVGKTIADIAKQSNEDPADTYMRLIATAREKNAGESVIGTSMSEEDIEALLSWPYTNICSDGMGAGLHPRGYGAFPRILSYYVREKSILTLEEAIRKMTSLAAENVGIPDRGLLSPGYFADLVLLDPATVKDKATTQNPHALAEGILRVWVNGKLVFENGKATTQRPGQIIKRNRTEVLEK